MPDAPPPEACEAFVPPRPWAEHIAIRPCLNADIFNATSTRNALWVKFTDARPLDDVALVCLADTPTPRVFFIVHGFTVLSTISMTVDGLSVLKLKHWPTIDGSSIFSASVR